MISFFENVYRKRIFHPILQEQNFPLAMTTTLLYWGAGAGMQGLISKNIVLDRIERWEAKEIPNIAEIIIL